MQASALLGDRNPLGPQIRAFCGDNTSAFTNDIQKGCCPILSNKKTRAQCNFWLGGYLEPSDSPAPKETQTVEVVAHGEV